MALQNKTTFNLILNHKLSVLSVICLQIVKVKKTYIKTFSNDASYQMSRSRFKYFKL